MSGFLEGQRALVTGGTQGIGLAVAQGLAAQGARVVICGRKEEKLAASVAQLRSVAGEDSAFGTTANVADSREVEKLFQFADKALGGLDILVNNAGVGLFRSAAEMTVEEWDRVIGTNLSGAFYCTREALGRFPEARGGRIINISSLAGKNPFAGGSAYNASKFGLNALSEATMLDHRFDNVGVSYIMPGSVDTAFSSEGGQGRSEWKIAPADIAELVLTILRMPARTLVSRIEVRPSRPQKN